MVEIGRMVLEKILKFRQCILRYLVNVSPWKRAGPFIRTKLNPLHPRMDFAKFEEDENVRRLRQRSQQRRRTTDNF